MILFLIFMKIVGFISWKQLLVLGAFEGLRQLYRKWEKEDENKVI